MHSKNFIKNLLIIDALQNTDRDNPKTAREILREVAEKLHKLFPNNFPEPKPEPKNNKLKQVPPTVYRIVNDMNLLKDLYRIEKHRDKTDTQSNETKSKHATEPGYYNAMEGKTFPFTPSEFALIAIALYRTPSISTEETETIIKKFKSLIGITGDIFSYSLVKKQIEQWNGIRRKTARQVLPIITDLLKAIAEERKITFNMLTYASEKASLKTRSKTRKKNEEIIITYKVSPYFLVWENDECYLIGHYPKNDSFEGQQLTHFKIALIDNLKILEEENEPLRKIDFYARYVMESHPYYTDDATRKRLAEIEKILQKDSSDAEFKNFSLDRYMREHIYMVSNNATTIDVTIEFDEDFLETIFTQLTFKQAVKPPTKDDKKWRTIITVQDNDGLYQWLMRYIDKIKVLEPKKVQEKLKRKLQIALEKLNG